MNNIDITMYCIKVGDEFLTISRTLSKNRPRTWYMKFAAMDALFEIRKEYPSAELFVLSFTVNPQLVKTASPF